MHSKAWGRIDLGILLDESVYPRLQVEQVFTDEAHAWKERGPEGYRGGCPWHDSRSGTEFVVEVDALRWWCTGCHAGGTPLQYLWRLRRGAGLTPQGRDFVELARELFDRAGVAFPQRQLSPDELSRLHVRDTRRAILETVLDHARGVLWSHKGEPARTYLHERGLTDERIRELGLGLYSLALEFRRVLKDRGFPPELVDETSVLWTKWEDYILVPWRDAYGYAQTIFGRWRSQHPPAGKPRTLQLPGEGAPDVPLFFNRARLAGQRDVVLVPGVMDAAVLQSLGDARAVACLGPRLSEEQIQTLARHRVRSVTLCADPGAAGVASVVASIQELAEAGIRPYIAPPLPYGQAPDEYALRQGMQEWQAFIQQSMPGIRWRVEGLLGDVQPDSADRERREAVERVLEFDAELRGDRVALEREDLLRLAAQRTGYSYEALAGIAEDHDTRRRRQDTEAALTQAVERAHDSLAQKVHVVDLVRDLTSELAGLERRAAGLPSRFSVDRLLKESSQVSPGRSSGWWGLDAAEVQFHPGELAVVAGRAGDGKTTFLANLLLNWLRKAEADSAGELFVFYSNRDPEIRIFHRLLALLTSEEHDATQHWDPRDIWTHLRAADRAGERPAQAGLERAIERLRLWEERLQIVHRPSWPADEVCLHAQTLGQHRRIGGVFVDLLQRVPPPGDRDQQQDVAIPSVARLLLRLAVDLAAPVIAAVELSSAAPEGACETALGSEAVGQAGVLSEWHPALADVRATGCEQEAELVLALVRSTGSGPGPERLEVGVLKNRHGRCGDRVLLQFDPGCGVVRDPAVG